jgi:hypothetical protein
MPLKHPGRPGQWFAAWMIATTVDPDSTSLPVYAYSTSSGNASSLTSRSSITADWLSTMPALNILRSTGDTLATTTRCTWGSVALSLQIQRY